MSESNIKPVEVESPSENLSDSAIRGILDFPHSPDSDIHSDNSSQKSEPKSEQEPEAQSDTKPEQKSEQKPEQKTEQKSEPKEEPKEEKTVGVIEGNSAQNGEIKEQKLGKNKWFLLLFVAGGTGIVLFIIGLIYTKVLNTGSRILDKTTVVVEEGAKEEEEEVIAEKTPGEELAEANAKVALVQQQTQLKAIEGQLEQQESPKLVEKAEPTPEPEKIESTPKPRSNQPVQKQVRTSRVQPSASSKPEKVIHTAADWHTLAALGDFGMVDYGSSDSSNLATRGRAVEVTANPPVGQYYPVSADNVLMANRNYASEEIKILQGRRRQEQGRGQRIQIGQQAKAHLVTPVLWVAAQVETQENFVVQLDQPILDTGGQVLLPIGTQIMLRIETVHASGLVVSEAHTLLKNGVEYSVPPGVLRIRGKSGSPLIASQRGQAGGQIAVRDTVGFTVGALGKVGEVMNRPDSQISTFSSGGFSQTSTNNGSPDYVGAVLEGGFEPLSENIQDRNRQATDRLLSRPQIWELDAGKSVQVFVNGTFEL